MTSQLYNISNVIRNSTQHTKKKSLSLDPLSSLLRQNKNAYDYSQQKQQMIREFRLLSQLQQIMNSLKLKILLTSQILHKKQNEYNKTEPATSRIDSRSLSEKNFNKTHFSSQQDQKSYCFPTPRSIQSPLPLFLSSNVAHHGAHVSEDVTRSKPESILGSNDNLLGHSTSQLDQLHCLEDSRPNTERGASFRYPSSQSKLGPLISPSQESISKNNKQSPKIMVQNHFSFHVSQSQQETPFKFRSSFHEKKSFQQTSESANINLPEKETEIKKRVLKFVEDNLGKNGENDDIATNIQQQATLKKNKSPSFFQGKRQSLLKREKINPCLRSQPESRELLTYRRQLERHNLKDQKDLETGEEVTNKQKHEKHIQSHLNKINLYLDRINGEENTHLQGTDKIKLVANNVLKMQRFNKLAKIKAEDSEQREYNRSLARFNQKVEQNSNIFIKEFHYKIMEFIEMSHSAKRACSHLTQVRGFNDLIRKILFEEGEDMIKSNLSPESIEKDLKQQITKAQNMLKNSKVTTGSFGAGNELKQLQFYFKNLSDLIQNKQFSDKVAMQSQFVSEFDQIKGILNKYILETNQDKQAIRKSCFKELMRCYKDEPPNFAMKNLPLENIKNLEKEYGKFDLISQFVREKDQQLSTLCRMYQNI